MDYRSTSSPETIVARAKLLQRTRKFFDSRGFLEVQTPLLSMDTVVDEHLDPLPVFVPHDASDPTTGRDMFLQTSPEFHMKRLLCSGMKKIYQISHAFRIGESGQLHNPEFMMLEWYRCGDDMHAGIRLLAEFASEILDRPTATMQSMAEVFAAKLGINPLSQTADELRKCCISKDVPFPESIHENDWDAWFELLFSNLIQPKLTEPTIIYDYPGSQSALAQTREDGEVTVAERFELFVEGIELANGYHELLNADELLARNKEINDKRMSQGKSALPEHSRLLNSMRAGMPSCAGVAVGFDRLVMLATNAKSIHNVLSFPIDRA